MLHLLRGFHDHRAFWSIVELMYFCGLVTVVMGRATNIIAYIAMADYLIFV